jgi:hypothetical protein
VLNIRPHKHLAAEMQRLEDLATLTHARIGLEELYVTPPPKRPVSHNGDTPSGPTKRIRNIPLSGEKRRSSLTPRKSNVRKTIFLSDDDDSASTNTNVQSASGFQNLPIPLPSIQPLLYQGGNSNHKWLDDLLLDYIVRLCQEAQHSPCVAYQSGIAASFINGFSPCLASSRLNTFRCVHIFKPNPSHWACVVYEIGHAPIVLDSIPTRRASAMTTDALRQLFPHETYFVIGSAARQTSHRNPFVREQVLCPTNR